VASRGVHWIVGAGGLLGSSVVATAPTTLRIWRPSGGVEWSNPAQWPECFDRSLREMHGVDDGDDWSIWWCAGRGTVSSSLEELRNERHALETLLVSLARSPKRWRERGSIVFSSSAGSVYAGTDEVPIRADSPPRPLTAYGRSKLELEKSVRWRASEIGMRSIVARITNLYGPRQDLGKGQGLVSRVCSAILRREPVPVFVSLGTVRNYVYASDAARLSWRLLYDESRGESVTSIVCSPANVSVGGVLKACELIADERALVRLEARSDSESLSRSVFFDPATTGSALFDYTPFHVGVHRVYSAVLEAWCTSGFAASRSAI